MDIVWTFWLSSLDVRASDWQLDDCMFDSRPPHCLVTTLGKLFTPICLCTAVCSGLVVACVAVVWEATGSCVYHDSHCNSTALGTGCAVCTLTTVPRSTQLSTLCGMVKWISAFGLSNNNKGRWWMWIVAATYRRTHSPSRLAWSDCRNLPPLIKTGVLFRWFIPNSRIWFQSIWIWMILSCRGLMKTRLKR